MPARAARSSGCPDAFPRRRIACGAQNDSSLEFMKPTFNPSAQAGLGRGSRARWLSIRIPALAASLAATVLVGERLEPELVLLLLLPMVALAARFGGPGFAGSAAALWGLGALGAHLAGTAAPFGSASLPSLHSWIESLGALTYFILVSALLIVLIDDRADRADRGDRRRPVREWIAAGRLARANAWRSQVEPVGPVDPVPQADRDAPAPRAGRLAPASTRHLAGGEPVAPVRDPVAVRGNWLASAAAYGSDALVVISRAGMILDANVSALALFGQRQGPRSQIIGLPAQILVQAEQQGVLASILETAFTGEKIVDRDLVCLAAGERRIEVSVAATPLADSAVVLALREIGERRAAEQRVRQVGAQLVRRAQELQAIFDAAPVGLAIADSPDCRHIRPNRALAKMLGVERSANVALVDTEMRTRPYELRLDGRPMRQSESPMRIAVTQARVVEGVEFELLMAGASLSMIAYAAPVLDHGRSVVGAIGVVIDITDMRRADEERERLLAEAITARRQAEEASRLKEEFLATVSHELRTPLNAMHGWLEIMQLKPDAQTQARGLDVIRRNVRAQTRVIEDILDVSSIVTGKSRVSLTPVDMAAVARAAYDSLSPTAEAKGLRLELMSPDSPARVMGDPDRLQQIAWNLLSNAIKFTPPQGSVAIGASVERDEVWLRVEDTGEGIAPLFLPYVFDRFRQADSSIERRHGGLGLGLSIVRHLAELHGGRVEASSSGLGKGASFIVKLPRLAHHEDGGAERPEQRPEQRPERAPGGVSVDAPGRLAGARVLLVEDEPSAAEMFMHGLAGEGASIAYAATADAALAHFLEGGVEILVSDIGLSGRDGCSLVRALRAHERELGWPSIYALAITAHARAEDRERALAAGFDGYMTKPVTPSQIADVLVRGAASRVAPASPRPLTS